jgi:hypothetical protein
MPGIMRNVSLQTAARKHWQEWHHGEFEKLAASFLPCRQPMLD